MRNATRVVKGWYIDNATDERLRKEYNARKERERAKRVYRPFCALKVRYGGYHMTPEKLQSSGFRECKASGGGEKINYVAKVPRVRHELRADMDAGKVVACGVRSQKYAHEITPAKHIAKAQRTHEATLSYRTFLYRNGLSL